MSSLKSDPPYLEPARMFAGGRLCLDFVNTLCENRGAKVEFLRDPQALRNWIETAPGFSNDSLGEPWSMVRGEACLKQAIELRSALTEVVLALIQTLTAPDHALAVVNSILRENPLYPQMAWENGTLTRTTSSEGEIWLAEIALDAMDLFVHADLSLLRQCECATCVRFFYDSTKNHKRRWCVEKCGSRVKSAAYYKRKREISLRTPRPSGGEGQG